MQGPVVKRPVIASPAAFHAQAYMARVSKHKESLALLLTELAHTKKAAASDQVVLTVPSGTS